MTPVFIIAEAGVNHNGSAERAMDMVETAANCGADAIKFQTFKADRLVTRDAPKALYQKVNTGEGGQYEMLSALEMSEELHRQLFARCEELGIEFMSTPFDEDAAAFLDDLGMIRFKIPSGEITNTAHLAALARLGKPLILSTGMATMAEVEEAVEVLAGASPQPLSDRLTILHCTSNYPAQANEVNLRAMRTIAERTGYPVGYSDHTLGLAVSTAAVALGAVVIEKHFTLDRALPGPDHAASLEPDELAALVKQIRTVSEALGSAEKKPTDAELEVRKAARRSLVAAVDLSPGDRLDADMITILRPGTGIAPGSRDAVIGRTLSRRVAAGQPISWDDLA